MKKIFIWMVSNDIRFLNAAVNILERQHNGVEIIGVTVPAEINFVWDDRKVPFIPLDKLTGGGVDERIGYSPRRRCKANRHE